MSAPAQNIGREDRLVRAGIALSLLMMAGFALFVSGQVGVAGIAFFVGFGYFTLTAAVSWDPLYAWGGLDTRPASPVASVWSADQLDLHESDLIPAAPLA